jgi:hypothetical protein
VQEELLELASATAEAALSEFAELKTSLLRAVRAVREHLHRHVAEVSGGSGLFDYLAESTPQLEADLDMLRQEHAAMGGCLQELEQRLVELDAGAPAALTELRRCADHLAELTMRHRASACRLADDACGAAGP